MVRLLWANSNSSSHSLHLCGSEKLEDEKSWGHGVAKRLLRSSCGLKGYYSVAMVIQVVGKIVPGGH